MKFNLQIPRSSLMAVKLLLRKQTKYSTVYDVVQTVRHRYSSDSVSSYFSIHVSGHSKKSVDRFVKTDRICRSRAASLATAVFYVRFPYPGSINSQLIRKSRIRVNFPTALLLFMTRTSRKQNRLFCHV